MSFDQKLFKTMPSIRVSIPFEQDDVFRPYYHYYGDLLCLSQSLSSRAMSFDHGGWLWIRLFNQSQSLSSRAMSFDIITWLSIYYYYCLNPFRAGRCLSTIKDLKETAKSVVSIPFEQGDVFRRRCNQRCGELRVSIPFEQGDVFRLRRATEIGIIKSSQSLSSRAMSFDPM